MDRRGHLAQSLDSSIGRSPGRWRRSLRRWFNALVDIDVPRGAGSAAVAALLLGSVCYGVVKGDHGPTIAENVQDLCDAAATAAGFGIAEVALTGERELARDEILKTAGITGRTSLLFLDAAQARVRLLTNPWIAEATVLKLYPGRLRIEIKERAPFALWQKDARTSLIATDGTVLEPSVPERFAKLPLVVGSGAAQAAPGFLEMVSHYPGVSKQVVASVLVAERRWNLHLTNGVDILLPEADAERALRTLTDLDRDKNLLARDIVLVDLRLADRVTVRLSDTAAAARDEAVKAAEKARKAKRKGTEA
ncbi:cell division protein FtsQ/DivIB [Undibacter mobilis]|uniref:Cell division protein FtsQ n=1 Tax=Undibacter mobilis TaxID=2292256 RepID=A0A371BBT0_9BRAD|nr:cell division protein FtsQ/DivIB [Undibacter mobilis]RDV04977.1 cell division protein FtsQ/DivIB [Undibacter mobilis]